MKASKQQVKSDEAAKDPYLVYKRRVQKDTLLADNPPAALGVGLVIVAVVLAASVASLRWVEYQETVPVILTLKTADGAGAVYGEAYMRPHEMTKVQTAQVVQIELGVSRAPEGVRAEATVGEIRTVSENALYAVRVDVPAELVEGSGVGPTTPQGVQVQGKILTQKQNLLDKLFGFFRMIAQSI